MDFQKAFNEVPHKPPLNKLNSFGIRGDFNFFFNSVEILYQLLDTSSKSIVRCLKRFYG